MAKPPAKLVAEVNIFLSLLSARFSSSSLDVLSSVSLFSAFLLFFIMLLVFEDLKVKT